MINTSPMGAFTTAAALLAVSLLAAGPAQGAPLTSTIEDPFTSVDLGGQIYQGRYSESYVGGDSLQVDNVLNVDSNDSAGVLGTQWLITNAEALSVQDYGIVDPLSADPRNLYVVTYGGDNVQMSLKDTGPWWNPLDAGTEYDVDVTDHSHYVYVGTVSGSVTAFMNIQGTFTDPAFSDYTVDVMLATAEQVGEGTGPDAGYPEYLPTGYDGEGQWGNVQQIQVVITPEPTTLGLVGFGAVLTLARWRRRVRRIA